MPTDPLPNAELHLHLEGTLEPELLVRIAGRNGVALPTTDVDELRARYVFDDLQAFLDIYYGNLAVLKTEQDFYDLASAYLAAARDGGVRRAESFFDPQVHVGNGVPLEALMIGYGTAFADARAAGQSCDLILCFLRDLGAEAAEEIFRAALPFREHFIGIGLDSAEVGYPPSLFQDVYAMAAAEGLHRVAHAGEEGGPDYVREALDLLGVERVDHGIRAMEDPELVRRLADEQIALTVCPLSNVALRAVPDLAAHPLPAMLEAGLRVTVSSDDPAYFGGYVENNFAALRSLGLGDDDLRTLAANSFDAAFIDDDARTAWKAELARTSPR
ncbi:MAG TPA: adenosine deaminase [Frankiaceae bacterium]|nr:adenosine deaminase [Frankiaceae bacterium]